MIFDYHEDDEGFDENGEYYDNRLKVIDELAHIDWDSAVEYMKVREAFLKGNEMKRTMTRRFYVGSTNVAHINERDGAHPILKLLPEAIAQGSDLVQSGQEEVVYIVEIIKVIRRVPQPTIIVEETR